MLWLLVYALSLPKLASHITPANAHQITIVASCFTVRHVFYDDLTRALTSTRRPTPFMFTVAFAVRPDPDACSRHDKEQLPPIRRLPVLFSWSTMILPVSLLCWGRELPVS